ncbi:MAG: BatA domain-containing protein, partial [Actinobacteria bacterium]|nr:BatA domain-containing protein [Actinomycetota bacterium]
MMFIDAAEAPRVHEPGRLREWTLLGVRMAAVCLLAIALARPVTQAFGGGGGGG